MIWALRNWRLVLAAVVAVALAWPVAVRIGRWQGAAAREAVLRAEAAEARLQMIEEERNRRDEIQTLDADDLHERLREWVLR